MYSDPPPSAARMEQPEIKIIITRVCTYDQGHVAEGMFFQDQ